jgi:hypothetical protein
LPPCQKSPAKLGKQLCCCARLWRESVFAEGGEVVKYKIWTERTLFWLNKRKNPAAYEALDKKIRPTGGRLTISGVDPDKVNVGVTEDSLALSGSVEKSSEEKGENFYRIERQAGQFSHEFVLPSKIDPDSVEAKAKKTAR